MKVFGTRLHTARVISGLSLQGLSDAIGNIVSKQSMSMYESGLMEPRRRTLNAIADALGVSEPCVNALINGRREFGKRTASEWQKQFGLSAAWLMTGEGDMLRTPIHAEEGSVQVMGNASNVNAGKTIDSLVELLKRKDEQIDRLIRLLEEKQK